MMNKTKVGIIGVGHLGRLHAGLYKEINNAEIVGIFDSDQQKATSVGSDLKVKAYERVDDLLEKSDAVNIVTPTTTHFNVAKVALEHDCHVFLEKPITRTEQEAEILIRIADEHQKIIQVGHIERFNPAILALSDVHLKPLFIESHRLAPFNPRGTDVAVILDLMIHDLDLILSLVKSKPGHIEASGVGVVSGSIDIANARIQFENGCVANVTASRISAKKMRKMRIFQQNAYISVDFVEGLSEIYYTEGDDHLNFQDGTLAFSLGQIDADSGKQEIRYNKLQRSGVNPLEYELSAFLDSIQNHTQPVVTGRDGLMALNLANRVLEKINEHAQLVTERGLN
jgi:predicted dehydrogenase